MKELSCQQVQLDIINDELNKYSAGPLKNHVKHCSSCAQFYQLHTKLQAAYQETIPQETPARIKHRLLKEFDSEKKETTSVITFFGYAFKPRIRTAIAFIFTIVFISLLVRPCFNTTFMTPAQQFTLFEQQDSLVLRNLRFVQAQNPGINSRHDSLLTKLFQVFP